MKLQQALIATLVAGASIAQSTPVMAQSIEVERFGLYVLADDVERSARFYEILLKSAPEVRTPALIGFNMAGGLFGIVSREAYAAHEPRAGSVRPYIKVADIAQAFAHASSVAPGSIEAPGIVSEGPFRFFRMTDSDGNVLEFFEFKPSVD
ncbi:VOC family protein [Erythrobacter sp. T5W1-R]|uniref:VOC family protein n=1 Tax=Erythrobacter sp. T5W1-R TaxID=3101752 RepID=UPI002AFEF211|nr:VOC family protein [Erythrobacter sp. T5W1-R]MEA1617649.1 VOC family protein [Erythrobacter sp. T5W1-R]